VGVEEISDFSTHCDEIKPAFRTQIHQLLQEIGVSSPQQFF
jgi:hypothetical protein